MHCVSLAAGTAMATVTVPMAQMNKTVQPLLVQIQNSCALRKTVVLRRQSFVMARKTALMLQMKIQSAVRPTYLFLFL